ncbi:MAG: HEPN domain-containing protein [bacterium]
MSKENQRDEALRWLRQARLDLETAQILLENKRFAAACFFTHQSAEKALKAVWYYLDEEPWGHSVEKMIEGLTSTEFKKRLLPLREDAIFLDRFYIPTRYPNGLPWPLIPEEAYFESDAQQSIDKSQEIVREVERLIEP